MNLDGVGEVTANRIIEYRNTYGFRSVDDLLNVKGIGEKKLANIKPFVCV
jgi:competence ComEA-like helix-hairpin-helix protein